MTDAHRLPRTVEELAAHVGGTVIGDKNRRIARCNGLSSAGSEDIRRMPYAPISATVWIDNC